MEPNIPVGSEKGVTDGMKRAVAGAEREQREGANGKWVAHWKMVHIVRPVWEKAGKDNYMGKQCPPLTYTQADADGLVLLEPAPRTVRGARDLLSVAAQYGNAFGQGMQAAALKPADYFGNEDVLYLMEDAATGEIRLSILWEWLHKNATLTEPDAATGVKAGDRFTLDLCKRLLAEEYEKLRKAGNRDVHDNSKDTSLPIAREIVETYVMDPVKMPWYIDLMNINLNNYSLEEGKRRIRMFTDAFQEGRYADHKESGVLNSGSGTSNPKLGVLSLGFEVPDPEFYFFTNFSTPFVTSPTKISPFGFTETLCASPNSPILP